MHLLILCTFSRFGESGFGESGFGESGFGESGLNRPCITPWAIQGLHLTMNCIWDTPPVIVKLERESRCFYEEPEISISISISTTVLHVDLFLCYALSTASTSTATNHWSGVFNWLKFDHTPKKARKKCLACCWTPTSLRSWFCTRMPSCVGCCCLHSWCCRRRHHSTGLVSAEVPRHDQQPHALWQPRRSCRQG